MSNFVPYSGVGGAVTEEAVGAVPYVEYHGDLVLMGSTDMTVGSANGFVPADPTSAEAVWADTGDWDQVPTEDQLVPAFTERVTDPLLDPYESDMLEGFLQNDFTPEKPILTMDATEYYDALAGDKPVEASVVVPAKRGPGRPRKLVTA